MYIPNTNSFNGFQNNGAWDRQCLTFIRANGLFNAMHPENNYWYFPTALDPTSWEQLPGQELTSTDIECETDWMLVDRQQRET